MRESILEITEKLREQIEASEKSLGELKYLFKCLQELLVSELDE